MAKYRSDKLAGFTIIEVLLVLAIAGLIFLVVFLALPTLQRIQRDTQRKQHLSHLLSSLESWRSNHQGQLLDTPGELANLQSMYLADLRDPSTGDPYELQFWTVGGVHVTTPPPTGTIIYQVGHICGTDTSETTYTTESAIFSHEVKQLAVLLTLEAAGVFCLDVE